MLRPKRPGNHYHNNLARNEETAAVSVIHLCCQVRKDSYMGITFSDIQSKILRGKRKSKELSALMGKVTC